MIIIYPSDKTTNILARIVSGITGQLKIELECFDFNYDNPQNTFDLIKNSDPFRTIIYLGHGTSNELNTNNGIDNIITVYDAKRMFKGKKVILLSCFSSKFLDNLHNQFDVAIGFGNILSSRDELIHQSVEYYKYKHDDFKSIDIFIEKLVSLFKDSIIEAYILNYTFLQLFNSLKLRINKTVSQSSLSRDKTDRLIGELMFKLKNEMKLFGNSKAIISDNVCL